MKKSFMKGVGAEHQVLMSTTFICECEHSHLHVSLISARHCSRATPFKKRKRLQSLELKKGKARKCHPDRTYIICIAVARNLRGNMTLSGVWMKKLGKYLVMSKKCFIFAAVFILKTVENKFESKNIYYMKHSILLSLLMFVCLGVFGQSSSVPPQKVILDQLQTTVDSQQATITTLQDSIRNLQMKMNDMKEEVKLYRDDFRHSVNDYNDKMDHWLNKLSILLTIVGILAALLGIVLPLWENKKLQSKIDTVEEKAKSIEAIKDQVDIIKAQINEDKIIVEDTAKEAKALQLYNEAVKEEDADKAIELYNQCIKNNPNFAEAYQNLGILKIKKNFPGEALENIEKAIKINDNLPEAYFYHGLLKYGIEGSQSTLDDIQKAIDKKTYYTEAYYVRALLEFEFGNSNDAVKNLEYARKLKSDVVESLSIRNFLTGRMKALDNAIYYCNYSDDMKTLIGLIKTKYAGNHGLKYLCDDLSSISIEIPNIVTVIGNGAFSDCESLTSIVIPNSVTVIGESAFSYCTSLSSIKIPDSVTEIGKDAFCGCRGIMKYEVSEKNPNYCSIDGALYSKDKAKLIRVPCDRDSFVIPNSVTVIGESAFERCSSLSTIVIPNSVTVIGRNAFYSCTRLTSIVIPNSVTQIGKGAFDGYNRLTSIVIPNSVTQIGEGTFVDCTNLTEIHLKHTSPIDFSKAFEYLFISNQKLNVSKITLYVPKGSCEEYKKHKFYKRFKGIIEE